jgi:acyl carrier protein/polyketide biosynthesis acyl carrier protein
MEKNMSYDDIFIVIKKNIKEVLDYTEIGEIDAQKSMKDYGADSLEMVEIVSRSMQELDINAPRTELMKVNNIDGLVNLFMKYSK